MAGLLNHGFSSAPVATWRIVNSGDAEKQMTNRWMEHPRAQLQVTLLERGRDDWHASLEA